MMPAAKALTRSVGALIAPCTAAVSTPPRFCRRTLATTGGSTPSSENSKMTNATPTRALRPESIAKRQAGEGSD
jgi:hypothetical protein